MLKGPLAVDQPGTFEAIAWLVGFTAVFAALAAWMVGRREYVLTKGD